MVFATLATGMEETVVLQYCDCPVDHGSYCWLGHTQHIVRRGSNA